MNFLHKILVQYMVRAGLMLCIDEVEVVDRRATLAAAFDEHDGKASASAPPPPAPAPTSEPAAPPPAGFAKDSPPPTQEGRGGALPKADADPGKAPAIAPAPEPEESGQQPVFSVDKPPQSWRAPQRAKWDKLDPDVRQEIMRRERETTKVLGETATARQMSNEFTQVVSPYQARIQSMGVTPMVAAHELFKADYILSTAPKGQRAQFMAKLINDYGIDIVELDNALSGRPVADPVDARVEALLAQRMKPLEQFLTAQQQAQVQAQQRSAQEVNQTVEQMSVDPKYPHFEAVRHDMADVIEISAKRGVYLTPEQAYNRAIAMNPEVSAQVATAQAAEAKRKTALEANSRAQRALNASTSVGGAPGGVPGGASEATDRRSAIAAAFDSIGR